MRCWTRRSLVSVSQCFATAMYCTGGLVFPITIEIPQHHPASCHAVLPLFRRSSLLNLSSLHSTHWNTKSYTDRLGLPVHHRRSCQSGECHVMTCIYLSSLGSLAYILLPLLHSFTPRVSLFSLSSFLRSGSSLGFSFSLVGTLHERLVFVFSGYPS